MKAIKTWLTLGAITVGTFTVACSGEDDSTSGDGDGDVTGGTSGDGDGDGDGDAAGGTSGDGDGDAAGGAGGGDTCSTILELAAGTAELSSLVAAVDAAGIGAALEGDDLTVFAPTNDAFEALLTALDLEFGDLTADQLVPILTYHVADSVVNSTAAVGVAGMEDNTFGTLGGTITLDLDGDDLIIDMGEVGATVVTADIEACNGVVHVIDQVILPSITDIVSTQAGFSGLLGLIAASDSSEVSVGAALDGTASEGAWTLFAPNNDAVAAAPEGLTAENITTALLYHAYNAETAVDAATALTLDATIQTAGGEDLDVLGDAEAGTVTLTDGAGNDVMVTIADIYASNGIIHVIDGVLIPPSLN